jgi:plasmid stabilization system protein ParE
MTSVIVSPEAACDLEDLTDRIAHSAGHVVATTYVDRIISAVQTRAAIPKAAGRPVSKLGPRLRCHPFGDYNLYLCYDESGDVL